jgi:hypothetical protein
MSIIVDIARARKIAETFGSSRRKSDWVEKDDWDPKLREMAVVLRLAFQRFVIVCGFDFGCDRVLSTFPRLGMNLTLTSFHSIQAFSKPSLLGPCPVAIKVRIKHRPLHNDPQKKHEQSLCHSRAVNFPAFFEC